MEPPLYIGERVMSLENCTFRNNLSSCGGTIIGYVPGVLNCVASGTGYKTSQLGAAINIGVGLALLVGFSCNRYIKYLEQTKPNVEKVRQIATSELGKEPISQDAESKSPTETDDRAKDTEISIMEKDPDSISKTPDSRFSIAMIRVEPTFENTDPRISDSCLCILKGFTYLNHLSYFSIVSVAAYSVVNDYTSVYITLGALGAWVLAATVHQCYQTNAPVNNSKTEDIENKTVVN